MRNLVNLAKRRTVKKILFGILLIVVLFFPVIFSSAREGFFALLNSHKDGYARILFVGNVGARAAAQEDLIYKLSLYNWDFVVLGDEDFADVKPEQWQKLSDSLVLFGKGNDNSTFSESFIGSIHLIFLKTKEGMQECNFDPGDIESLTKAVYKKSEYKVLFLDSPCWKMEGMWPEDIEKKMRGNVDLVVSGNGEGFEIVDIEGVRYLLNGFPDSASDTNFLTLSMIQPKADSLIVSKLMLADTTRLDNSSLLSLPKYTVTVPKDELRNIYEIMPVYDAELHWTAKIDEDPEIMDTSVNGKLDLDGKTYDVNIAVRGNIGNHWEGIKKSWNINFVNGPGPDGNLQLKFIFPEDREYVGQVFVGFVNEQFGVMSPKTTVGTLTINDIDFGPYLIYEDFDERFIELNGYNPDVAICKSTFGDRFSDYPIFEDLNYLIKSPRKEDKSFQQPIFATAGEYEDFVNFFEKENYRRWIATQIYTGDRHQNYLDNIRVFRDTSTGRFLFVGWDQYFRKYRPLKSFVWFPGKIIEVPEELAAIKEIIRQELWKTPMYREKLHSLVDTLLPVFLNDPFPMEEESKIYTFNMELLDVFENNIIEMEKLVYGQNN